MGRTDVAQTSTEPLVLEVTNELDILVHYDDEPIEAARPVASA